MGAETFLDLGLFRQTISISHIIHHREQNKYKRLICKKDTVTFSSLWWLELS